MMWTAVLLAGLASYLLRVLPLLLLGRVELPGRVTEALQHAAMGAMVVMLVTGAVHAAGFGAGAATGAAPPSAPRCRRSVARSVSSPVWPSAWCSAAVAGPCPWSSWRPCPCSPPPAGWPSPSRPGWAERASRPCAA